MLICHLEKLIKKNGLKKYYVAEYLGVSVRQLRKYETMESFVPVDKMFMLFELLKCKFDDLYERNEDIN